MRLALAFVVVLSGCGASGAHGPAWPKTAERETDGGESIAPREQAVVATADDVGDDAPGVAVVEAGAPAPPTATATATATPTATPTISAPDDTITVEEITIEIGDD